MTLCKTAVNFRDLTNTAAKLGPEKVGAIIDMDKTVGKKIFVSCSGTNSYHHLLAIICGTDETFPINTQSAYVDGSRRRAISLLSYKTAYCIGTVVCVLCYAYNGTAVTTH